MCIISAGEDGLIKVWSRSGMLRSVIVRGNSSILTSDWSPDCTKILYSQGGYLFFQSLNSNSKPYKVTDFFSFVFIVFYFILFYIFYYKDYFLLVLLVACSRRSCPDRLLESQSRIYYIRWGRLSIQSLGF